MPKFFFFLLFFSFFLQAQTDSTFVDNKYLEDQLYIDLTFIKLINLPDQISQTGFSYGLGFGFIKDLPLNQRRNIGLGFGLGYNFNTYFFNVKEDLVFPEVNTSNVLTSNKITVHMIEMPIEFRYRTSTALTYKFWRFYPGFKMAYVFANNSSLKQRENFNVKDIIQINEFLYGATLSAGYNKWNLYFYYGLNDLFTNTKRNSYDININDIRIGIIFFVL